MGRKELTQEQAKAKLWEMGELSWKLKGKQKNIYNDIKNAENDVSCILVSRRFGKCIAEGTKIPTTKGLKNIEDIKIGDYVYGYTQEGIIEPTKVEQLHDQGIKEVVDLVHNKKKYATVTEDHKFLVYNPVTEKESVKPIKEMRSHEKIRREFIEVSCGEINEPQAYTIGALLGDGCSRQGINSIHISGEDEEVILKCKEQLNAKFYYRQNDKNFTWVISNNPKLERRGYSGKRNPKPFCALYEEWCSNRYAHEKIVNLDIVKQWDRQSCLEFLAGIIDTDGCVTVNSNILKISIHSQSKSIIDACRFLFKQLFLVDLTIYKDNRDKYKNERVYFLQLNNNLHSKRILKELTNYLQVPRKKWKEEYSLLLENNTNSKFIGIKKENKRKMQCWDIGINNRTHLFVMQNGLITHNSFTNCLVAVETCIKQPNAIVKYACPKQRMVQTIIKPIMREIFKDAPFEYDLSEMWKANDKIYVFPNGSEIQIAGTDNGNSENLRGGYAQLLICDEAGFMDDLDYVVNSILLPTTDTTDGKLILTSTPNYKDPHHEFHESFVFPIEAEGRLVKYTLYDSPMVDEQKIAKIISRYPGGIENPKFRCEYLCEIPKLTENTVIPEFTSSKEICLLDEDTKLPDHYDAYVSGDVGFRDLTAILFAYYDFMNAQLVVLDELIMNGPEMTTDALAKQIKHYEELRFYNEEINMPVSPYLRIMDNDLKLINDLMRLHDLHFIATKKDNKEAQINQVRLWVHQGKIKIHPRCKHLLYHLENAQWDKNRKEFKQLKDSLNGEIRGGHCDSLDALIYLVRNINESRNPFPEDYNKLKGPGIFSSRHKNEPSSVQKFMNTIMNIRK